VALLDTLPGVAVETAQRIVAEMGVDMSRFPSAGHLSAWAGAAPGNHESGGKRRGGKRRRGNQPLLATMVQAAWAATHAQDNYFRALYYRLVRRSGKKKALLAVAHAMLVAAYHMLKNHEPYRELGADYFEPRDEKAKAAKAKRLLKQLAHLGYPVAPQPVAAAA
jgi:transposase